jgi:hypothetical protein
MPGVEPLGQVSLSLQGVRALGRSWDISASSGVIAVEAAA